MNDGEMSAVERVAALLEGVEEGHVAVADLASIGAEIVHALASLVTAPAGWVADLGRMLSAPALGLRDGGAAATSERSSNI